MIYFDNAAKTKPLTCAVQAYMDALNLANPSSEHAAGVAAKKVLEDARAKIAGIMGCDTDELYFVSTATEAAATIIGSLKRNWFNVYCGKKEHHAVSENCDNASHECDAWHDMDAWCAMYGNNETGEIEQSPKIKYGFLCVCDATASVGHVPVKFKELGADYLFADALKFGGVPGAAFFIGKNNGYTTFPLIRGGGQERGVRAGTENVPAIAAMAAALEWSEKNMEKNESHCRALCGEMLRCLDNSLTGWAQNKGNGASLPHILNISFDGVDGKTLAMMLSKRGVMVSAGAACSSGNNEPSHVIMAMYNDEKRARGAIRISFSHENTFAEVNQAAKEISEIVRYLREVS